ncbi:threonine synthase [Arachidicoccus ginsenosidimutans]|uniref:threonine synthase n=1 Tax=Arachidicoccus sp. BS20 TaxID=1850526 RepID=UPI0007F068FB|nr:threonine synthase [Arachidicoccus sp. BS20]ANI88734.1 threonine synthase [Arachidicoccus sp. BS20]
MKYYSLHKAAPDVDFREAVVNGQAPDKGLYFPESIPQLPKDFVERLSSLSKEEISFKVMKPYVGESIPDDVLQKIVSETINFPFPLIRVDENIFSLELFHGPTYAFKDVGARFMSRCLGYFNQSSSKKTTILVATSGDTGGAVANGFLGVEGVEVIILYPSKKVSPVQELQLTTLGENITALEVQGSFDDCQAIVKQAFIDEDLKQKYQLTSANSINVGRWLPQQLYYFFALQNWQEKEPPVICVPSGNFGNICAGVLANVSGMPVKHFIAACNANDTIPLFLETNSYQPKNSVSTISNAMDVGNPSNFVRILELFHQQTNDLKKHFTAVSVSDDETRKTISDVYDDAGYLLDPHGAVAYKALSDYLKINKSDKGIFLETAHPVKFPDVIEELLQIKIPLPENAKTLFAKEKQSILIDASFDKVKDWMMNR